jgi:hypothetical protein
MLRITVPGHRLHGALTATTESQPYVGCEPLSLFCESGKRLHPCVDKIGLEQQLQHDKVLAAILRVVKAIPQYIDVKG